MSRLLWNLYAHCYDRIAGLLPYQEMLDEVVAKLELSPGTRVLDAGCGTGALADRLAARCPDIELVAVDRSPSMLKLARARREWPASFKFVEGSIEDVLASDERGFDRIASVNVIWTLPDPERTLRNMTARLRNGGRMVHTTPSWRFRAPAIVWRHVLGQKGWRRRLGALLGLPVLALAGLLNLILVVQSMVFAHAPRASRRWHADGLAELLRAAGAPPRTVIPCYAGQNLLLVCEKEEANRPATRLPVPGEHL
ncbi:MAG TPA: class I SAM-dependent methyltransferase [Polyangia bacterium]